MAGNQTSSYHSPYIPWNLRHALDVIKDVYGDQCYYKPKTLSKFGRIDDLGQSYETIQEHGGTEEMLEDNLIDTAVSDDAGDTGLIVVEGHTIDGDGRLKFVSQEVTLDGTTEVTLGTPLARANRIQNTGGTDFAGTVSVKDTSTGVVYVEASGAFNQSEKCATSISGDDYWVITEIYSSVLKKQAASVDYSLQVRNQGGVFREVYGFSSTSTAAPSTLLLEAPIIVPANSDVRVVGIGSTTGIECIARISGYLAKVE